MFSFFRLPGQTQRAKLAGNQRCLLSTAGQAKPLALVLAGKKLVLQLTSLTTAISGVIFAISVRHRSHPSKGMMCHQDMMMHSILL